MQTAPGNLSPGAARQPLADRHVLRSAVVETMVPSVEHGDATINERAVDIAFDDSAEGDGQVEQLRQVEDTDVDVSVVVGPAEPCARDTVGAVFGRLDDVAVTHDVLESVPCLVGGQKCRRERAVLERPSDCVVTDVGSLVAEAEDERPG